MFILNVDEVKNFRRGIIKSAFQIIYSKEFYFCQTQSPFFDKKEYIDAEEINTGEKCKIYIFQKPKNKDIDNKYKTIIYYLSRPKVINAQKNYEIRLISRKFIDFLNNEAHNGFFDIASKNRLIYNFDSNAIVDNIFYKYYSSAQTADRFSHTTAGDIAFVNPEKFNDPFDCDYEDILKHRTKNSFKALCLSKKYDDILMWSYYASDHGGYCLGYSLKDILERLNNKYNGLCLIGNVIYKSSRPRHYNIKALSLFDEILFTIQCTFTKFAGWKNENEYRVLIFNDCNASDYFTINVPIKETYSGVNSRILLSDAIKLKKDKNKYIIKR